MLQNRIYYLLKPFIPRNLQLFLRRKIILGQRIFYKNIWPIDEKAGKQVAGWPGWPDQKKFALVLTHDVDTESGQEKCLELMKIEKEIGFRSSFNFVPERYHVSGSLRNELTRNGFEVGVHGLLHDGKLYSSKEIFRERAIKINQYLEKWKAVGFRSPAMHHNLKWMHDLNIEYDASTFDTDPFEPQPDGLQTIFPVFVKLDSTAKGYVELPYTLPQDFTLFVLLKNTNKIWKNKLDWIASQGGMVLMNTHPDYMNFNGKNINPEEYPVEYYAEFLDHIKVKYKGKYWHALPKEMARFWMSFSSTTSI